MAAAEQSKDFTVVEQIKGLMSATDLEFQAHSATIRQNLTGAICKENDFNAELYEVSEYLHFSGKI